jgi:hypothetical protein
VNAIPSPKSGSTRSHFHYPQETAMSRRILSQAGIGSGRPCFNEGRKIAQIVAGRANVAPRSKKHEMANVL